MPLLFVYGSLKAGFPNAHHNTGRRLPGVYVTATAYPLMLLRGVLPCLVLAPGQGLAVRGEVYDVTSADLDAMDRFERVGEPGGYLREAIGVQLASGLPDAATLSAEVYGQASTALQGPEPHAGPFNDYTLEHAKLLRW